MAAAKKTVRRPVLDLDGKNVVSLVVLPELPVCYGTYEVDICDGEFCAYVFEKCKKDSENARCAATEKVSLRDNETVPDMPPVKAT